MQVSHFCCLSCGKSLGEHNIPFRRMRMGILQPRDLILMAISSNQFFGFNEETPWDERLAMRETLFESFSKHMPLESVDTVFNTTTAPIGPLQRSGEQIEQEAQLFGDIVNENGGDRQQAIQYYIDIISHQFDAPTAYNALGISRLCCKRSTVNLPIWPVFAADRPEGSIITHDKGLRRRVVFRLPEENGYTYINVMSRVVEATNAPVVDQEIEEMDF